jgi:hypothetical protein
VDVPKASNRLLEMYTLQDTSKPAKGKRGNKRGKRGREPTIVIVFFHRTTIDGESSQKLNKIGKTFSSRCGVYLAISRKDKSIKQKTKAGESGGKRQNLFPLCGKRQKYFWQKFPPLEYFVHTFAGFEVSCCSSSRPVLFATKNVVQRTDGRDRSFDDDDCRMRVSCSIEE